MDPTEETLVKFWQEDLYIHRRSDYSGISPVRTTAIAPWVRALPCNDQSLENGTWQSTQRNPRRSALLKTFLTSPSASEGRNQRNISVFGLVNSTLSFQSLYKKNPILFAQRVRAKLFPALEAQPTALTMRSKFTVFGPLSSVSSA